MSKKQKQTANTARPAPLMGRVLALGGGLVRAARKGLPRMWALLAGRNKRRYALYR